MSAVTRIDREELAYPHGSLRRSGRRGLVRIADGRIVSVLLGVSDTYFTIPARCRIDGKTVSGYVFSKDVPRESEPEYRFQAMGRNRDRSDWCQTLS